ncbi:hypothetical protein AVEN_93727-1, partial [Araneus ventricosus]
IPFNTESHRSHHNDSVVRQSKESDVNWDGLNLSLHTVTKNRRVGIRECSPTSRIVKKRRFIPRIFQKNTEHM